VEGLSGEQPINTSARSAKIPDWIIRVNLLILIPPIGSPGVPAWRPLAGRATR
jgi:hypothetical protein